MNIIEKYDKPFQYGALVLNLLMAYQFFMLWYAPTPLDVDKIMTFINLMIFEFIMVHSGIPMAILPKKLSLYIIVPVYLIFAIGFNLAAEDNTIIILYCTVVFNRMRFAFSDTSLNLKARVIFNAIAVVLIYFVLIITLVMLEHEIPNLGLTYDFLQSTGFNSNGDTGLFIEKPHVTMCFGVLYYIALTLIDAYFLSRKPWEGLINKFKILKNVETYKTFKTNQYLKK